MTVKHSLIGRDSPAHRDHPRPAGLRLGVLLFGACAWISSVAWGAPPVLPQNGTVSVGTATIGTPVGNQLTINQTTQQAAINWQSFSVGANATVRFNQPNATSSTLNRVTGDTPSSIAGRISAPGTVLLVNPNGIVFMPGSVINVGSLAASTLSLSDANYQSGNLTFQGNGASKQVSNAGTITAADGGYVALVGGSVANSGTISASLGKVGLGAGEYVTLDLAGDGFLQVAVPSANAANLTDASGQALTALVSNSGTVSARGGQIYLSAAIAKGAAIDAVNVSGTLRAQSVSSQGGQIVLQGGDGTTEVSGTLDASGTAASQTGGTLDTGGAVAGQTGGTIEILGEHVGLLAGAEVTVAGAAGGGSVQAGGSAKGAGPLPNADAFYMDPTATINADATINGNGGHVVTYGTSSNRTYGAISARGGAAGGQGGMVETSGDWLDTAGARVDLRASDGSAGEWLLDPMDITISSAANSNTTGAPNYAPSGTGTASVINAAGIATALSTSDVTITTAGAGTSTTGNIAINSSIAYTGTRAASLTMTTTLGGIALNSPANITSTNAPLNVSLTAGNSAGTNNHGVNLANETISTDGGNITLNGVGTGTNGYGVVLNGATLQAAGGNISVTGTESGTAANGIGITTNATVSTTGSGSVTMNGTSTANSNLSGIGFDGAVSVTAGTGGITMIASDLWCGALLFNPSGLGPTTLTTTGAINLTGTETRSSGYVVGQSYNAGVAFYGTVTLNAGGAVNITGTTNAGAYVPGISDIGGTLSVTGASITLTGTAHGLGSTTDTQNTASGVRLPISTTNFTATSGNITINGSSDATIGLGGAGVSMLVTPIITLPVGGQFIINGTSTVTGGTAVNIGPRSTSAATL